MVLVKRVEHVMRVGAGIYKKNVHKYQGVNEFHMLARKVTGEVIDVGFTVSQKYIGVFPKCFH